MISLASCSRRKARTCSSLNLDPSWSGSYFGPDSSLIATKRGGHSRLKHVEEGNQDDVRVINEKNIWQDLRGFSVYSSHLRSPEGSRPCLVPQREVQRPPRPRS
jgi:hypothetical protein